MGKKRLEKRRRKPKKAKLQKLKRKAAKEQSKVEVFSERLLLDRSAENTRVKYPDYWAPFRNDANQVIIEIINATERPVKEERDRIIDIFVKGGAGNYGQVVSLKRIQNRDRLQKFLTETRKLHDLGSNDIPFEIEKTHYLFHGPRENLDNILKEGGLSSKYSRSHTTGQVGRIWLHQKSSYSIGYANHANNGNRRVFICRAIHDAELASDGGVYTYANDYYVLLEYLIEVQ